MGSESLEADGTTQPPPSFHRAPGRALVLACRLRPARAVPVGGPACRRSLPHALRGYALRGLPPCTEPPPRLPAARALVVGYARPAARLCQLPFCSECRSRPVLRRVRPCTCDCLPAAPCSGCAACSPHLLPPPLLEPGPPRRRHHRTPQPPMPQLPQ